MRTIAFGCRHDFWVMHSEAGEGSIRTLSPHGRTLRRRYGKGEQQAERVA